jgi:hypothetical protein
LGVDRRGCSSQTWTGRILWAASCGRILRAHFATFVIAAFLLGALKTLGGGPPPASPSGRSAGRSCPTCCQAPPPTRSGRSWRLARSGRTLLVPLCAPLLQGNTNGQADHTTHTPLLGAPGRAGGAGLTHPCRWRCHRPGRRLSLRSVEFCPERQDKSGCGLRIVFVHLRCWHLPV